MATLWRRGVAVISYDSVPPTVAYPTLRPAALLRDAGFDVHFVARGDRRGRHEVEGVTAWVEPGVSAMASRIARLRPELFFNEFTTYGTLFGSLARRSWVRNPPLTEHRVAVGLQRIAVSRFDAVSFTNPHHRTLWRIADRRIVDLPYPVDVAFWSDVPERDPAFWTRRGLEPPPGPVLVYVANLLARKRQPELVEDLAATLRDRDDLRLVLVGGAGDAVTPAAINAAIDREGLEGRVLCTGWLRPPDVRQVLAWATLSVVHTAHETQCMVLYESMAAGVPVLMPGLPELRSQLPYVATHEDAADLRANVARMLEDPAEGQAQLSAASDALRWVDMGRHDDLFADTVARLTGRGFG